MASAGGFGRFVAWCRVHPKAAALIVVGVIVLAVIGELTGKPTTAPASQASQLAPFSAQTPPVTPPAARSATTQHTSAAAHTSTAPKPRAPKMTAAPVDTRRRSSRAALAVLATVPIKGRAPMTGYSRDQFGSAWTDDNNDPLGHNGCDTRNDILRRDLAHTTIDSDTDGCVVLTGVLHDPYTGRTISFRRGETTSLAVQIDHVVALGDAWQTGAQGWAESTRIGLANDPLNLLAVDGPTNEAKGDADDASWLPPNTTYRCAYVARQIAVKASYRLWMTPAEHAAAAHILTSCPHQKVPTESPPATITSRPHPQPVAHPVTSSPPPSDVYYKNCDAARAAGAAPLRKGQPGYRPGLDRDGDGVACED